MKLLFTMDAADYDPAWPHITRPSARAIIRRGPLLAMVYAPKFDYYKTPGGGLAPDELPEQALIREVAEETGLLLLPESIRPFGHVLRLQRDSFGEGKIFVQENYYYIADAAEQTVSRHLDAYEADEGFTLRWVTPQQAIDVNRSHDHHGYDALMIQREARVLELLL